MCLCWSYGDIISAQESNYWTQQYGARSSLLGGAVIHGVEDNSAVYYNPAALAFIKQSTISLNTSVYKYEDIFIRNGGGDNIDLQSQRISLHPNMTSGLLTKDPSKKYRFGFNILTRSHANYDFMMQYESVKEIIDTQDGEEFYIGRIELQTNVSETWGCLGGGYKINEHLSLGATAIITYRNQRHHMLFSGRALNSPDSTGQSGASLFMATNSVDFNFRTNTINALFKFGLHARTGGWRFGLNITTPSVPLWGQGRVQREEVQTNLPGNRDQIKADQQSYLQSEYRYPFTIGLGVAFNYSDYGMVSFASEYYSRIGAYQFITANASDPTFPNFLSGGVEGFLSVYQAANQVLNFGFGWEHSITKKIKLHLGVRTDFTSAVSRQEIGELTPLSAALDIYHFSGGLSFRRKASKFSIGINYSYANKKVPQLLNLSDPVIDTQERLFLFGVRENNAAIYAHGVTAMIGYTYYFALK